MLYKSGNDIHNRHTYMVIICLRCYYNNTVIIQKKGTFTK